MLSFLATGQRKQFDDFAAHDAHLTRHLTGYGLVYQSEHGCTFNIESLRQHLENKHRFDRENLTGDQKLAELSERRNALEQKLRNLLGKALRLAHGPKTRDHIVAALPESRRDGLKDLSHSSLLSVDSSPLFFLDLVALVGREWEYIQHVFNSEKAVVLGMLNDINRFGRPDAHAKAISDEDFRQVRIHLSRLEKALSDW